MLEEGDDIQNIHAKSCKQIYICSVFSNISFLFLFKYFYVNYTLTLVVYKLKNILSYDNKNQQVS